MPTTERTTAFISYSHADKAWLTRLQPYLKPFEHSGQLKVWDDTKIKTGQNWENEIRTALQECKIAILLVSQDFLASDYVHWKELPVLLQKAESEGAVILSLIVEHCTFGMSPIKKYQAFNPPEQPLADMKKNDVNRLLVSVANRINEILQSHPNNNQEVQVGFGDHASDLTAEVTISPRPDAQIIEEVAVSYREAVRARVAALEQEHQRVSGMPELDEDNNPKVRSSFGILMMGMKQEYQLSQEDRQLLELIPRHLGIPFPRQLMKLSNVYCGPVFYSPQGFRIKRDFSGRDRHIAALLENLTDLMQEFASDLEEQLHQGQFQKIRIQLHNTKPHSLKDVQVQLVKPVDHVQLFTELPQEDPGEIKPHKLSKEPLVLNHHGDAVAPGARVCIFELYVYRKWPEPRPSHLQLTVHSQLHQTPVVFNLTLNPSSDLA